MRRGFLFLVLLLLGTDVAGEAQVSKGRWKFYTNVRFQYAICYPTDIFKADGEYPNSASNSFRGRNGEILVVTGEYTTESLAERRAHQAADISASLGPITYQASFPHAYVLSASGGGSVLYTKTFLHDGQMESFTLTYPVAEQKQFGSVVKGISTCFADLQLNDKLTFPRE